jgi:hypothetical protein
VTLVTYKLRALYYFARKPAIFAPRSQTEWPNLANKRTIAMKNISTTLEITEEEILSFDVSDEALEIAGGSSHEKANFTLGGCSGLSVCPG